jgi:hypothetical protein
MVDDFIIVMPLVKATHFKLEIAVPEMCGYYTTPICLLRATCMTVHQRIREHWHHSNLPHPAGK